MLRLRLLALALLTAACATTTPPASSTAPLTTTQPVVVAVATDTPAPTVPITGAPSATPTATDPIIAGATATPASTATPSPTLGPCANDADFLDDLTVPDGTQFEPGQPINKQWSVRNNGTCDWDSLYRLVLVSGNALGARSEHMLYPARAGTDAVIELNMVAPAEPGSYTGRWPARSPEGALFGARIFITIEVVAPAPAETPSETPNP